MPIEDKKVRVGESEQLDLRVGDSEIIIIYDRALRFYSVISLLVLFALNGKTPSFLV